VRWGDESDREGAKLEQIKLIPRRRRRWKKTFINLVVMLLIGYVWYRMLCVIYLFLRE
jgi:hypothetical protein